MGKIKTLTDKDTYFRREPSTIISGPSNGQFDIGTTPSNTPIHEFFDIIDNHVPRRKSFRY